jgi:hypothetical protein
MDKNYINLPGRKIVKGEKPTLSARAQEDTTFLIGDVVKVDVDRQKMIVNLRRNLGMGLVVNITQPYAGISSFIQATPEEGSIVLLAKQENDLIPIAYLPHYPFGLENRNVKVYPDNIKIQNKNEYFFRLKKLEQGWLALGSKDGIEILLSDELMIDDRTGNNFILRPIDNSIISTSNNNYLFSSGIWRNAGIIRRNSINSSYLSELPNVFKDVEIKGKSSYVIRPFNSNESTDPYLIEYLLEVEDKGFGTKPINDVNFSSNKDIRKPIAIFCLGNYVGNNPNDTNYGKVLKPILFTDPDDIEGNFLLEPISGEEIDTHAAAIVLYKPNKVDPSLGSFIGIDKEGHLYQYLPSTTGGGLGKGRSMSILARGNKKEVWGHDTRYACSWDMHTTGGIKWIVGAHNERDGNPYSNRSIDIRTSKSVFFMYGSELVSDLYDFDNKDQKINNIRKYYKIEKIGGFERKEVEGTSEEIINGSNKVHIKGAKVEKINSASTLQIGNGYNIVVGDAFTEKVIKEKNESYGNRRTIIISGSNELIINSPKGDIIEKINNTGNKKVSLNVGSIEEEIRVGNKNVKINSGNYDISTKIGNFSLSTQTGQGTIRTKNGSLTIAANMNISIKTSKTSNIDIEGGVIALKGRGISGGVVTDKTHLDYITGAPLKGSLSVTATS